MPDFPQFAGVVNTSNIANDAVTTAKIIDDAVTNAKLANVAALSLKGNLLGVSANPQDIPTSALVAPVPGEWGFYGIWITAEINMAATGTTIAVPTTAFTAGTKLVQFVTFFDYTSKDGSVTTGPTLNIGTNAGINDLAASQTIAAFASQAVNTRILITNPSPIPTNIDPTVNGIKVQVTGAAVLNTATACKARLYLQLHMGIY
jgi:hypothetical protein